ncbi:cold shock domain-containing protein [Pseudoxanthomonas sp. 10H]|uniref:cold shock domain-containing protein n=1 Tax=Pseudoxanthomonas sp. 10H TaxID=3242729 RepID=UPI0035578C0F
MRTHGVLAKWNDDRGFGFIAPAGGGAEIFVHVSAFPRDGSRPHLNELVSFETESGPDGKTRAIRIMRPGAGAASRRSRPARRADSASRLPQVLGTGISLLAIVAIGTYAWSRVAGTFGGRHAAPVAPAVSMRDVPASSAAFECDGRTLCSEMTSCAEATYFIQHCPGVRMDGNGDGVPCEQQWCD